MKYISVTEYLMGRIKPEEIPEEHFRNMNILIPKVNDLLEKFGSYRSCNSGYRTEADQIRIYKDINEKRKKQGLAEVQVPMGSAHLKGAAIDLEDKDKQLKVWINNNLKFIDSLDLYFESFQVTDSWVHCQILKPKSGKRFFIP